MFNDRNNLSNHFKSLVQHRQFVGNSGENNINSVALPSPDWSSCSPVFADCQLPLLSSGKFLLQLWLE